MTTRERIIEYLKNNPDTFTSEIGKALGLTRADIQYHLKLLNQNGILVSRLSPGQPKSHKGRPRKSYRLSGIVQPDNYVHLATSIFQYILSANKFESEKTLRFLANKMFPPLGNKKNISLMLNETTQILSHHNYSAFWEAHVSGPIIIFRNCPYQTMLSHAPDLCLLDIYILENLTGERISQLEKMADFQTGKTHCRFRVCLDI